MLCQNCGTPLDESDQAYSLCSTRLLGTNRIHSEKGSAKLWTLVLGGCVAVMFLCFLTAIRTHPSNSDTMPTSTDNSETGGGTTVIANPVSPVAAQSPNKPLAPERTDADSSGDEAVQSSATGDFLTQTLHPAAPPFDGLPDLAKTVFLAKGSLVCDSDGALFGVARLLNENARNGNDPRMVVWILRNSHCTIADRDIQVTVLLPSANEPQEYLREKLAQVVSIEWSNSDGSLDIAWTRVPNLHN